VTDYSQDIVRTVSEASDGEVVEPAGEWVTRQEAARRLACDVRTIDRQTQSGRLRKRVRENGQVDVWIARQDAVGTITPSGQDSALALLTDVAGDLRGMLEQLTSRVEALSRENGHLSATVRQRDEQAAEFERENAQLAERLAAAEARLRALGAPASNLDVHAAEPTRETSSLRWRRWLAWVGLAL
jgi:FtsZ-binding cell division protein ZapB